MYAAWPRPRDDQAAPAFNSVNYACALEHFLGLDLVSYPPNTAVFQNLATAEASHMINMSNLTNQLAPITSAFHFLLQDFRKFLYTRLGLSKMGKPLHINAYLISTFRNLVKMLNKCAIYSGHKIKVYLRS